MEKNTKGITLIVLVITIVVLIILAGVSIAMLTGQNGILTQANNAKNETERASAKEKAELAVVGAIAKSNDGSLTIDNLKEELSNYGIATDKTEFPVEIELDGQKLVINNSGKVTNYKEMAKITGQETANTTTKDSLGNYIVVPAGFKIINPTENVTNGIVVEDVSHSATAGSQFVWIPVGNVIKDSSGNSEKIKLSRYTFADDSVGTPTDKSSAEIENSYDSNYKHTEINISPNGNTTAKENIESEESGFRKSVKENHGYYIGRYEARENGTQVTVKASDIVYNNITQPNAATVSRGMYSDSNFKSDLMNSYAWDTAIVFLQKFDNRTNKTKPYSRQTSLNDSLVNKGTNSLEASKQDKICNVYDMASNCYEWTTEVCNNFNDPCTYRGGYYYYNGGYTSYRYSASTSASTGDFSFRTLLYM
mgnify:CR=1 FL=1